MNTAINAVDCVNLPSWNFFAGPSGTFRVLETKPRRVLGRREARLNKAVTVPDHSSVARF
jgi:hypothetical protein